MKRIRLLIRLGAFLVIAANPAQARRLSTRTHPAAQEAEPPSEAIEGLPIFRISQLSVLQSGGNSFTGELSWNPALHLTGVLSLSGNLGVSDYRGRTGSDFIVLEAQAFAAVTLERWSVEAGAGQERWGAAESGSYFAPGGNVLYRLDSPFLAVFDRVVAGYTFVSVPGFATQELKLGLEAKL